MPSLKTPRRTDGELRTTTPGSLSDGIATGVLVASVAANRALTVAEHRAAYVQMHGAAPAAYTAILHSLVKRGIILAVAGRASATRYCHRDHVVGGDDPLLDDDLATVERALISANRRHGRTVTTREVRAELKALGLGISTDHPNGVRQRLESLARTRRRGPADWHLPRAEKLTASVGAADYLSTRWRATACAVPHHDALPGSDVQAALRAVQEAQAACGGPVTARAMMWWVRAHADTPLGQRLAETALGKLLQWGARRPPTAAGASLVRHAWHQAALADGDPRYEVVAAGATAAAVAVACWRAIAELRALSLDEEDRDIRILTTRATRRRSVPLAEIATVRQALVVGRVHAILAAAAAATGLAPDAVLAAASALAAQDAATVASWIERARGGDHARLAHTADAARTTATLAVAGALLRRSVPPVTPGVTVVGPATAGDPAVLEPLVTAALAAGELAPTGANASRLLRSCRWVRPGARVLAGAGQVPILAGRDRADVLLTLGRRIGTPVVHALLASAHELLGAVLRDSRLVAAVRAAAATGGNAPDPAVWRAALVAGGLLGDRPDPADAALTATDSLSARAYALAALLAEGVGAGGADGALTTLLRARGEAGRVAMQVRTALRAGRGLDAVR